MPTVHNTEDRVGRIWTKFDLKSRVNEIRVYLRRKLIDVRTFIYEMALPITGVAVEDILNPTSLVPTMVCGDFVHPCMPLASSFINVEFVR